MWDVFPDFYDSTFHIRLRCQNPFASGVGLLPGKWIFFLKRLCLFFRINRSSFLLNNREVAFELPPSSKILDRRTSLSSEFFPKLDSLP